ncbi:hypothetical protein ACJMK2_032874 [Sinanodonta woodiana]|uniref:Phosphodiesterase n=1 Tax=Sinanodonta woodiana TaxID=1069815 RepID=A0ABD3X4M2_SINWO
MVILTCQLIGNAVLAMIDPDRFRRGESNFKSPSNLDKCQQCGASVSQNTNRLVDAVSQAKHEALLNLLEASDLPTLSRAVAKVLTACISSATGCAVFFKPLDASLHEDQLEVFIGEREHVRLHPDNGSSIIWDAYYHGRTVCVNGWVVPESLFTIIRSNSWGYVRQETKVSCLPVQKDANSPVLAVLVVSHNEEWNQYDIWELSHLSKQLSACYSHIQRAFQGRGSRRTEESCSQALMKLCGDLYDQDAGQLQLKVIKYLEEQTRSEVAFLVLVVPDTQELFCQVQGDQILEEEVRFPNSYFAAALETKRPIYLEDVPVDAQKEIEDLVHRPLNSLLCVPVTSKTSDQLIALVCLINKKDGNKFTSDDITCIQQSFCYTSSVLTSTLAFQNERKLKNQTQAMLKVARHLFTNLGDLTKLLREVMQQARNLTQAERCSVFLIENETEELVAKVFDGITTNDEVQTEIRMPVTQGIAGHVATTGELLNIKDAYSHHLFYRGIDESTGFRTRNILCFPIKDENEVVLGVAQLCNKKTGPFFTAFDEEVATAFGIYCCIAISHSLMYTKVQEAQHRNKLANELMIYHMQVSDDDMKTLARSEIPTPKKIDPDFDKFTYPPRVVPEFETLKNSISIVEDLGFISRWRIRKETLVRFLMMVKRGYRNPPYHNWMHAYSVGHFCYLLVKNLQLQNFLDDIEIFGLFVSCLCHDIDHRGTNNSFQVASQSILAALYSSEGSVMERHHFAQTMCILNTEGCNIFENLSSRDYQHVLDIVRDVILATDLAHHLRILKSLEAMAKEGYNKSSTKCHKLLLCLLMTACDLSDQTKKWENTKHIAALVYKEFFSQGDLEKAIGKEPIEMMDRERAKIPDLQISFLQHIAAPVYNLLSDLFPAAEPVSRAVKENCAHWEKIANKVKLRRGGSCAKMSIEQILALEVEDETDASKTCDKDNQQQSEVSENGCPSPVTLQDADHNHTEQVGQG